MRSHHICVIGSGYVGLVTGVCLAELGHHVVCVDSDRRKLAGLRAGKIPIYEPGLDKLFKKNSKRGHLDFALSVKEGMYFKGHAAEVVFIAVGTPPRPDGSADLSAVEIVASEIARSLRAYTVVVDKSTVPVETGEWVQRTIQRLNARSIPYDVVSNPEFLSEGTAVRDFLEPDRIVLGVSSPRAEKLMREIYAPIKTTILVTDVKSAELIKHASNSFLATKISFINAVSSLCEKVGADVHKVAEGMGLDRRIGSMFLKAGLGFGGFCFPKDLEAFRWIARQKGYDFKLLDAVKDINEYQKTWMLRRFSEKLWNLEGKTLAILGLAFKPNTDDMRFAPSLDIVKAFHERGVRLRVYDPVAMARAKELPEMKNARFCKNPYECCLGADALAIVTEWPQFKELDLKKVRKLLRQPLILDGRNIFDPAELRALGFDYHGVGRP